MHFHVEGVHELRPEGPQFVNVLNMKIHTYIVFLFVLVTAAIADGKTLGTLLSLLLGNPLSPSCDGTLEVEWATVVGAARLVTRQLSSFVGNPLSPCD